MSNSQSGVTRFLRSYRQIITGGVAVGVPLPTILAPIAPTIGGIKIIAALTEIVVLLVLFRLLERAAKHRVRRIMVIAAGALPMTFLLYFSAFTFFTVDLPGKHDRIIRGLACTESAEQLYGARCPFLGKTELLEAEGNPLDLWKEPSIEAVQIGLMVFWCIAWANLACFLGTFLLSASNKTEKSVNSAGRGTSSRPSFS